MSTPSQDACDLLVLGSGPAGFAVAIQALCAGLDVIVIEARERSPVAPGETLHPGAEPLFERLGVRDAVRSAGFHRHRGVWVEWDEPRRFEAYGSDASGSWLGFQVDRRQLHRLLLDALVERGVTVHRPLAAQAVLFEGARVAGVVAGGRPLSARWTVDATGRRAWLARALGLDRIRHSPVMQVHFGWVDGEDPALDGQPVIAATREGWRWHAPLGNARTAWASLAVRPQSTIDDSRPNRGGVDLTWGIHQACAGPGYFLLGDAAAVLDPSSSHGVLRALMSGMMCAHMVAQHVAGRISASTAVGAYREWLQTWFEADALALRELYRRHPSPDVAARFC